VTDTQDPLAKEEAAKEETFQYHLNDGSDLLRAGRIADAKTQFERALQVRPHNEQALNLLGLSLHRLGEFDRAVEVFRALIHENPVEASLRLNLAMVLLKMNDLDGAQKELEVVVDLNPDHPRAATYMGLVMEKKDRFASAASWYDRAGNEERAQQMRSRAEEEAAAPVAAVEDAPVEETREFAPAAGLTPEPAEPPAAPPAASFGLDDAPAAASTAAPDDALSMPSLDDASDLDDLPSLDDDDDDVDPLALDPVALEPEALAPVAAPPPSLDDVDSSDVAAVTAEISPALSADMAEAAGDVPAFSTDVGDADLSELDDLPSLEDDPLDLVPPSLDDDDDDGNGVPDAFEADDAVPDSASDTLDDAELDDLPALDDDLPSLDDDDDDPLDLEPPSLDDVDGEGNGEDAAAVDEFSEAPTTDVGADDEVVDSWEDSAIAEDAIVDDDDAPDALAASADPLDDDPLADDVDEAFAPPSAVDDDAPADEPPLSQGAEAAALTAATRDAMQRPAEVPPAESADAARHASMGFTLELDGEDSTPPQPAAVEEVTTPDPEPTAPAPAPVEAAPSAPAPVEAAPSAAAPAAVLDDNEEVIVPDSTPPVVAEPVLAPPPSMSAPQGLHALHLHDFQVTMGAHGDLEGSHVRDDGAVVLPVEDVLQIRSDLLASLSGQFEIEPLNRRYRGRRTDTLFGGEQAPMIAVMGEGKCILDPGDLDVTALDLDNDELYLLEGSLIAFTSGLVWENGRLPSEDGDDLDIVHLRGDGSVLFGTEHPLRAYTVSENAPLTLQASRLVGWKGRVVPYRGKLVGLPDNANRPSIVRFEGEGLVVAR